MRCARSPLQPMCKGWYFFEVEFFEIGNLSVEGDMWQFSSGFEGRSVGDDVVADFLFEMGLGEVLLLLEDVVVDEDVGQSLDLMSWDFQFGLDVSYVFLGEENGPVLFDFLLVYYVLQRSHINYLTLQQQLQLLEISQTLVFKTGDFCCDFEALGVLKGNVIDDVEQFLPVTVFLVRRQDEDLTDPMSFLYGRQSKDILRKHAYNVFPGLSLQLLEDHVVLPTINCLKDKGNSIDVKQKEHFQSFLERCESCITATVLHDLKFILSSLVSVNQLSNRRHKGLFLFFQLKESFSLVKLLPPSAESNPVVSLISSQYLRDYFCILYAELIRLDFLLLLQLHPIVKGR